MIRAAVYISDITDEFELAMMESWCRRHGYDPKVIINDGPGLAAAIDMYLAGEIDVLVVTSRRKLPIPLEIITVETEVDVPRQTGRRARPTRVHRSGGASRQPPANGPR